MSTRKQSSPFQPKAISASTMISLRSPLHPLQYYRSFLLQASCYATREAYFGCIQTTVGGIAVCKVSGCPSRPPRLPQRSTCDQAGHHWSKNRQVLVKIWGLSSCTVCRVMVT